VVALSTLVAVMTTVAGVLGMIVSQAIGAVLVDMHFLEAFLGARVEKVCVHSVEDESFGRLGIGSI